MAITHDYVDYLDEQIGIAPAGSQEEFQAAQLIADEIRQHGLEPSVEEFDVHSSNGIEVAFFAILLFVGTILSGYFGCCNNAGCRCSICVEVS